MNTLLQDSKNVFKTTSADLIYSQTPFTRITETHSIILSSSPPLLFSNGK